MTTLQLHDKFSAVSNEICNILYLKQYDRNKVNSLIDILNAEPYKGGFFVSKNDASSLITALCLNIKSSDEVLVAKTSHLLSSIVTKQNIQFSDEFCARIMQWHIECLDKCSDVILPDLLHNLQTLLQNQPSAAIKFTDKLIGSEGILLNLINSRSNNSSNPLQITLICLKCIGCLTSLPEEKLLEQCNNYCEIKDILAQIILNLLLKGFNKIQDEFLYYKVIVASLRVLSQLYLTGSMKIPLPEVMGVSRYYILLGLVAQDTKPEKIMPSQQTIAPIPVSRNSKGGKKQKLRKQRNTAIESLKKEIPVSDRSLMKDVDNFENHSAYKPASWNYLDPVRNKTSAWTMTSDSDMSDLESGNEAKLVTLKSRVRQSAANLLLVVIKVTEKRDIFGYWWALLPDSPDVNCWSSDSNCKKTLAYCAVTDPIASSRASVLSVILSLLSGSRMYMSQAETSKKESSSFIPFSVSLGYIITCMHKVLVGILDSERVHSVIIIALKCCAALVQATPYHKMKEGLISELVRSSRRFLVHSDVTLQVGALISMGCVLSIDPKIDEVIKSIEKDLPKCSNAMKNKQLNEECDDFEEGYSDDEMFVSEEISGTESTDKDIQYFKSWILDICFKNMGWLFKGTEIVKCKPSAIPVILESLQVLSAISFHHFSELVLPHMSVLADVLSQMLKYDHQDVVLQAATTISIAGDAMQKLDQSNNSPPLKQCVSFWEKLLIPLSTVLQTSENPHSKAVVCDCIANIGEKPFQELPRRLQVLCCTLLVGSCSDEQSVVRAAAVRALAMAVMYNTLREDVCFVSDCGENILRALSEPVLVVRSKAAWALGNLSDALVLNMEDPEIDDIEDDLLLRLLEVSVQCVSDNDKVKMSATRSLGNLVRLIKADSLERKPQLRPLCETAVQKLLECACRVTNMKVRWNACYAIGNAMKNEHLFTCFSGWQRKVFPSLCSLAQECKNLKVRINAAVALRAVKTRAQYGEHYVTTWRCIMAAMETAANVDDFTEYRHKDNLIEQLCVTLAHMCCLLQQSDLADIIDPLVFHFDCSKSLFQQLCHKLPPENASCMNILQAAKHVTVDLTANSDVQQQALSMLQDIFIWDM